MSQRSRAFLGIMNLACFIAVVVVNALATTIPLGGYTTGELSDMYPNLFVPAGLTFSIWGVIYLLLGIYSVYGLVRSMRAPSGNGDFVERIGPLFIVSCAGNAGWILSWHYRILPLSMVCMLTILASLLAVYLRLSIGRSQAAGAEKFMAHLPMSVYLGWITVATIANATALLVHYRWNGFGITDQAWTIAMIAIAVALGLIVAFLRGDIFFTLVVAWAVLGILIKRSATDSADTRGIIVASIVGLSLLSLGILTQIARRKVYR